MRKGSKTSSFGTTARIGHDASDFYNRSLYQGRKPKTTPVTQGNTSTPSPLLARGQAQSSPTKGERDFSSASTSHEQIEPQADIIYCHDSQDMYHLPAASVHLMITSPPYNVGKDYDDDLTLDEYKTLLSNVMQETYRVLVEGGRACVNIANVGRSPYLPLHAYLIEIAQDCGFFMRGEIIWDKGVSGASCAWGSWQSASNPVLRDVHEYILIFCKGTFKRHPIKQNSISRDDFLEHTKSIWRFPAASAKQAGHPAPFPVELPLRLIHLYSYESDIVLDPFIGSGTTAQAALQAKRRYVGYEKKQAYVDAAREKLRHFQAELVTAAGRF